MLRHAQPKGLTLPTLLLPAPPPAQVLPGGVASQVASYAKQNREAGLSPAYHPRHRWEQRRRQDAAGSGSPRAAAAGSPRAGQPEEPGGEVEGEAMQQ